MQKGRALMVKCPDCGCEVKPRTYSFSKVLTKSGNSLVITITDETRQALDLKHGDLLDVKITKI